MRRKTYVLRMIITVVWCLLMFALALQTADSSSGLSDGLITRFLGALLALGLPQELLSTIVRKFAHFFEFAVAGFLMKRLELPKRALYGTCAVLAVTNELAQILSEGRSCSPVDMLIDFCGALTGIAAAVGFEHLWTKIRRWKT